MQAPPPHAAISTQRPVPAQPLSTPAIGRHSLLHGLALQFLRSDWQMENVSEHDGTKLPPWVRLWQAGELLGMPGGPRIGVQQLAPGQHCAASGCPIDCMVSPVTPCAHAPAAKLHLDSTPPLTYCLRTQPTPPATPRHSWTTLCFAPCRIVGCATMPRTPSRWWAH